MGADADNEHGRRVITAGLLEAAEARSVELDAMLRTLAASSSRSSLDLLLHAIVHHDLARPGIVSVRNDPHFVDEVRQDVLIAVAEKAGTYRGESAFTTWLHGVARYKALGALRRLRTDTTDIENQPLGLDAARVSSLVATQAAVRALLDGIDQRYREPVLLRDVSRYSYDEIAAQLELPIGTVRSRISRGRALLAHELANAR